MTAYFPACYQNMPRVLATLALEFRDLSEPISANFTRPAGEFLRDGDSVAIWRETEVLGVFEVINPLDGMIYAIVASSIRTAESLALTIARSNAR